MSKPRGVLIAGNWKMNHGPKETEVFFRALGDPPLAPGVEAAIFPPFLSVSTALQSAPKSVQIGAQNVHWESKGAFTGETSALMLKESGVTLALVGHSERRQYFGESNETVCKRSKTALDQGVRAMICIGETRTEREAGKTLSILTEQMRVFESLRDHLEHPGRIVIAYEPVWAIGTGLTATPAQAEEAHQFIRKNLWDHYGLQVAGQTKILYGGSVTPENVDGLLACPNIDGGLVGGASLKPESFSALLRAASKLPY